MISPPVQSVTEQYCCSVSYDPSRSRQSPHSACAAGSRSGETMAKKARKKTTSVQEVLPLTSVFDEMFPTIARWISQEEGWVELGADHHSRSLVRALYGGGMAWEGTDEYGSLDEALRAMEEGIAAWLEANRPASGARGEADRATGGPRRRAGKKAGDRARSASPERARTRRPSLPKATPRPEEADRARSDATPAVPRAVVEKVRKFADIAEGLRRGQRFEITRLTSIKGLCKDHEAARSFARFLAVSARKRAEEKKIPERVRELMDRAIKEMGSYLDDPSKERKERLYPFLREMEQEQDEHKRISWGMVRLVHSMELVVVEDALKAILREDEAPTWL